jgi:pyrroline-5-carboxylate reductase
MVEGGIFLGLPAAQAQQYACEMMAGAAEMALKSPESLCELRWKVCSPGGSTIAGVKELEDMGVRSAMINALLASFSRSQQK